MPTREEARRRAREGHEREAELAGERHIHGLGVNPADDSLYVATHAGLHRAADGSTQAPCVGDSDRDPMGFSVVRPGHLVASGHPGTARALL